MNTQAEDLVVVSPLMLEVSSVRRGLGGGCVVRAGPHARRSRRVETALRQHPGAAVAVAGVAGALVHDLRPGDLVVASEVRSAQGTHHCRSAPLLAAALRKAGLTVHMGPMVESDHVVWQPEGARLALDGAIAVDMESARLLDLIGSRPSVVVRAVVDTPSRSLLHPATVPGGIAALSALREVGPSLRKWAAATRDRTVLLAGPRSFCAGVERAVEIVERLLDRHAPPVYVRKQIVHNSRVVGDLERRGAVFVEELDEVPENATVVFSAHGVSPAVREDASRRRLDVVDATCPLVSKVHGEAKRFARDGDTVFLIGHAGHEEVEGTLGEAPDRTVLVERPEDVADIEVEDPARVSYLMQTTLAMDEAEGVVTALRQRFPALRGPGSDDICYATTNRQDAVRVVARDSDVVLVAGSPNSSNSLRLVEVAQREGTPAYLVDDVGELDLDWLASAGTVGLSAGASAPTVLVDEIVDALAGLGAVQVRERTTATETVNFSLPKEVRHR
ncbi:4-hydroxy-3-methylbut-2-enyl diphosphate reductase [Prauserella marina]|uniref:4-hydroxy-3-methylbut-2-enyl diphosphate reductase n=1 Tax=Prauserella marina TaxID=530584 RepID=A0A222VPV1_9PSEU|nr:4-hydroxy-3-methylbut-2-enyl diphosphate reductase [Prauserella marina]ASR35945.1 4-hydroxy-3-methylbut-2-enyl diphosphate reductase [Prauserella marina]PWV84126.1 4-hydroxy-3-methylbut-2-enyl diphosphate reductase [Prauserella marina]SDC29746.1 4-hydroxy-3-methylbut-2-enyl diphosphate reductase [Prauserella marina]